MTRMTREHPMAEQLPDMTTEALWDYVLLEAGFLATEDQRRVPRALYAAIEEAGRRAGVREAQISRAHRQAAKLTATLGS